MSTLSRSRLTAWWRRYAPIVLPVALLSGCASASPPGITARPSTGNREAGPACAIGDTALMRDVVYFGRNRPDGGRVGDTEWQEFLTEVVTPRFPSGLTVVEAVGQWRGESGLVEQERSEVVTLLHAGDEPSHRAVTEIAAEYKRRFRQEAVLRERTAICARFE
jgi:hypothetical protein